MTFVETWPLRGKLQYPAKRDGRVDTVPRESGLQQHHMATRGQPRKPLLIFWAVRQKR